MLVTKCRRGHSGHQWSFINVDLTNSRMKNALEAMTITSFASRLVEIGPAMLMISYHE